LPGSAPGDKAYGTAAAAATVSVRRAAEQPARNRVCGSPVDFMWRKRVNWGITWAELWTIGGRPKNLEIAGRNLLCGSTI
jgi:hypothetical protein